MTTPRPRRRYGLNRRQTSFLGAVAVLAINATIAVPFARDLWHNHVIETGSYKQTHGYWQTINLPKDIQVNAVHAALLSTGKVLITAGSGNNADTFNAGTFVTMLFDPTTGTGKRIDTPTDMFCGGQSILPDGRLLIAGGTQNYEVLANAAKKAGGRVTITNTRTGGSGRLVSSGTILVGANGKRYATDADVIVPPATVKPGAHGTTYVANGTATVWAYAVDEGKEAVFTPEVKGAKLILSIDGLTGDDAASLSLTAPDMVIGKHDFEGSAFSYVFDPKTEQYQRVSDLTVKRWYPTLTPLADGEVLATSGLDGTGQLLTGKHSSEEFDPTTNSWRPRPDLVQDFATYPALFQTAEPNTLFYTGANTGYGDTKSNEPGLWNLKTNAFTAVGEPREPNLTDSGGSAWLGPVQNQRIALVGGGETGESITSTKRIDTIDLATAAPAYEAGPALPHPTRYPLLVNLPDDSLFITGGSGSYRGENASSNLDAGVLSADGLTYTRLASPHVRRSYHSEALLLPDGRVLTMGSNPLYSDPSNTRIAPFEHRLELYTPPYLFAGPRPVIASAPTTATLGSTITVTSPDSGRIASARLLRPGASTHAMNVEQRDVALTLTRSGNTLTLGIPSSTAIAPAGDYMLFLVDTRGVPSVATWIHLS